MDAYHVLVSCPLIKDSIHEYADRFEEHGISYDVADVDQQLSEEQLLERIDKYDGVIAGDDELTATVLQRASRLKVISKWGIGVDNIDLDTAERQGIDVYRTPGAFSAEVADVVIGYTIMLTRQLHLIDRDIRAGEWSCPRGVSLCGKTFGVVGVGNIGSSVARRAHAFGTDVLGHDVRQISDDLKRETGIEQVPLEELLQRSHVVSLNCSLTEETENLIGHSELEALGEDSYLINTARGELIDQPKLVEALRNGAIAGAALDVFWEEPLPQDHPLAELENVILGSHNAQNTHEAVSQVNDRAVENLLEGLCGSSESDTH